MNYMWKFLSNFKEFYNEINSATLTGAIDVIVIKQEDGSYSTSPFHVRFGKIGVLRSREKVVDIEINGEPVDIHMKLGESGEAFFVEEIDDPSEFPSYLATSPIPTYPDIRRELERIKRNSEQDETANTVQIITPTNPPILLASSFETTSTENQFEAVVVAQKADHVVLQLDDIASVDTGATSSNLSIKSENIPESKVDYIGSTTFDLTGDLTMRTDQLHSADDSALLADSSTFKPIIDNDISRSVPTNSQPMNTPSISQNVGSSESGVESAELFMEEDKTKMKKKRKRKSIQRRKPQIKNLEDVMVTDSKDAISSDYPNDAIFQMDVDDNLPPDSIHSSQNFLSTNNTANQVNSMQSCTINKEQWPFGEMTLPSSNYHPYSDGDISASNSREGSRPSTPKSDTEYEIQRMEAASQTESDEHRWSWTWGELPVPPKVPNEKEREEASSDDDSSAKAKQIKKDQEEQRSMFGGVFQLMGMSKKERQTQESEGIYLDDLNAMEPEMAALYISTNSTWSSPKQGKGMPVKDEDAESGNGSSLTQSPHSVEGAIGGPVPGTDSDSDERNVSDSKDYLDIALSLCGNIAQYDGEVPHEIFQKALVTHDNYCNNPNLFQNPDLVIRIAGKYYNWQTAAPMLMSLVVFQRPLPDAIVNNLIKDHMPKKTKKAEGRGYSWFYWRKSTVPETDNKKGEKKVEEENSKLQKPTSLVPSPPPLPDTSYEHEPISISSGSSPEGTTTNNKPEVAEESSGAVDFDTESKSPSVVDAPRSRHPEKYKKSLRLSSEQIAKLNLKEGPNEVLFSVTTAYQGTTRCKCHIYLWKYDDQIVISDIDGTITKSDVLGHILPIVGKSWAQSGVAHLFSKIKDNGYQFLYLSARAIGQARITREYLRSIRQGDVSLPDGPLLLSPSSLISALHREVIEKKPEVFKISCLRDIQALFTSGNPFYAGYGNRINDVWAYRAIGIPMSKIFTINHKGELKQEKSRTFQSSYSGLSYVVDHVFPPLHRSVCSGFLTTDFIGAEEFSSFTYWRDPLPDIEIELEEEKPKKMLEKKSDKK